MLASSMQLQVHPPEIRASQVTGLSAPTIRLSGHSADLFALSFSPDGQCIASAGLDNEIWLWDVYSSGDQSQGGSLGVLKGHGAAILEIQWSGYDPSKLVSCSADKTLGLWDVVQGKRLRKISGHEGIVNSCQISGNLIVSGSDDSTIRVWDIRLGKQAMIHSYEHDYQILSVAMDNSNQNVYAGSLDNYVLKVPLKSFQDPQIIGECGDSVTGLSVSPDENFIVSNSMDNSVTVWDNRPVCVSHNRIISKIDSAVMHSPEKLLLRARWSPQGQYFAAGSSDGVLSVFNSRGRDIAYRLPGHKASLNDLSFSPKDPRIIASCSSDRTVILGELSQQF